jgi:hypothetical protein
MKALSVRNGLAIIAVGCLIASCSSFGTYKLYTGPQRPATETALIEGADSTIIIASCDGVRFSSTSVSVLPGNHTVEMLYSGGGSYSADTSFLEFTAEAGHKYHVDKTLNTGPGRYTPFILDKTTGKQVSRFMIKPGSEQQRLEIVEKSLKEHPREATFWLEKGDLLCKLKRYEEALPCLETALSLKSDQNGGFWSLKSFVLYNLKRYDEALADIDKAIKLRNNENDKKGRETVLKAMKAK